MKAYEISFDGKEHAFVLKHTLMKARRANPHIKTNVKVEGAKAYVSDLGKFVNKTLDAIGAKYKIREVEYAF